MENMFSNEELDDSLRSLGRRLRDARIAKGDTQGVFAARLGVSVPTLRALEQGSPTASLGLLAAALWVLSRQHELEAVLPPQQSLFVDAAPAKPQRVSRRRRKTP